ncbi:MAG TPA: shikimate dehydrogenase [Leifsonia sp.]
MSVVGESYLVGLIGEGVLPSLTPPLHEAEADAQGLRYLYRPLDLPSIGRRPDELGLLLSEAQGLGFTAVNITHPCKREAMRHLDEADASAASVGAANTVLFRNGRRIGHNTDVTGFAAALHDGLPGADLARVAIVGAGGAGAAVACALLEAGAGRVTLLDIESGPAEALAGRLRPRFPGVALSGASVSAVDGVLADATGVVNASFVGMHSHPGVPFDPALLHPGLWVADVVYRPLDTELLRAARLRGCRTLDGGVMAVGQAADAFRLITGLEPDRARMRAHFTSMIERGL